MVYKGKISALESVDDSGNPKEVRVTYNSVVSPPITIPWTLMGGLGELKIGDDVAFFLFDDLTGVIAARFDSYGGTEFPQGITVKGNITAEGNISAVNLSTTAIGSVNAHTHSGVQPGLGATSGPQ